MELGGQHYLFSTTSPLAPDRKLRREDARIARCSSLITSGRLLDNRTSFQLEFTENIAGLLLTLSKNVLELSKNSLKTSPCAHII
jgi:hypothetical protein